jgi:hypothetical protein
MREAPGHGRRLGEGAIVLPSDASREQIIASIPSMTASAL